MAVSETIPSRNRIFGIPIDRLNLFQSLLMATAFGFMVFFATCFIAIFALLFYNELGHHTVDMADAYLYAAFPAGVVALAVAELVMFGFWLRRKISGR
jgi:hypothetical protein